MEFVNHVLLSVSPLLITLFLLHQLVLLVELLVKSSPRQVHLVLLLQLLLVLWVSGILVVVVLMFVLVLVQLPLLAPTTVYAITSQELVIVSLDLVVLIVVWIVLRLYLPLPLLPLLFLPHFLHLLSISLHLFVMAMDFVEILDVNANLVTPLLTTVLLPALDSLLFHLLLLQLAN